MGMRSLPFFKGKKGYQFAGGGITSDGGGGSLPIASTDTLGGIKVGNGLSITSEGVLSSSGGDVYTTDEVDTGAVWIDGKHIYRKVLTNNELASYGDKEYEWLNCPIEMVVSLNACCYDPNNYGRISLIGMDYYKTLTVSGDTTLMIFMAEAKTNNYTRYAIVYYTKKST